MDIVEIETVILLPQSKGMHHAEFQSYLPFLSARILFICGSILQFVRFLASLVALGEKRFLHLDLNFPAESLDGGFTDGAGVQIGVASCYDGADNRNPAGDRFADGFLGQLDRDALEDFLDDPQATLFEDESFTDADKYVTRQHGGTVSKQAVDHRLLVQLGGFPIAGGDVGNHLLLDIPYFFKIRNDGEQSHRPGRKSQCGGNRSGFDACDSNDIPRAILGCVADRFIGYGNAGDQFF